MPTRCGSWPAGRTSFWRTTTSSRRDQRRLCRRVEDACRRGGSTVLALGSSPGFVAERLATPSPDTPSRSPRDVLERMDCTDLDAHVYPLLGFGAKPRTSPRSDHRDVRPHVPADSARDGRSIGSAARRGRRRRPVRDHATRTDEVTAPVPPGTVAGTEFSWTGLIDGAPVRAITCRWVCDLEIPGWDATTTGSSPSKGRRRCSFVMRVVFVRRRVRHGGHVDDPER